METKLNLQGCDWNRVPEQEFPEFKPVKVKDITGGLARVGELFHRKTLSGSPENVSKIQHIDGIPDERYKKLTSSDTLLKDHDNNFKI